jgi:sugar phosphate isomerase/epimerase
MNRIALHCSSFVAKQCGYGPHSSWENCVQAVNEHYRPPETFARRFEQLLLDVQALGYEALDVWTPGQLNWRWATDEHIAMARELLQHYGMSVTSLAGEFGATPEEFRAACRLANGIHAPLLSGTTSLLFEERAFVVSTLKECELKLAIENHPEINAQEMLQEIGNGGEGRIGTAVDTGWYATRGYDVVRAVEELNGHILHVHLKDVLPGVEHLNCGWGEGCVPLEATVRALKELGYAGDYSVEDHALDHDPTEELKAARPVLRQWLAARP